MSAEEDAAKVVVVGDLYLRVSCLGHVVGRKRMIFGPLPVFFLRRSIIAVIGRRIGSGLPGRDGVNAGF